MHGIIIPIGGNEDKGVGENEMYTLEFIDKGILATMVKESGGKHSRIVVVTTASSIPKEVGKNYEDAFSKLGCTDVHIIDIRSREKAESDEVMSLIRTCQCLMFS